MPNEKEFLEKNNEHTDISKQPSVPSGLENASSKDIIDYLFSNKNKLLTSTNGEFALSQDSRGLLAYFAGGEIIISRTHRYDGRVLAFLGLLRQHNIQTKQPFYSDLALVSNIYKTNDKLF